MARAMYLPRLIRNHAAPASLDGGIFGNRRVQFNKNLADKIVDNPVSLAWNRGWGG